ncbi:PAS domain-containing protein, partial [Streptomyces sp. Agncl-13]|uniref:PAS domain-containing protein n=1 Tax=Streptomyces sp. Agncl-13 TaxID=3400628 RepID=UPI003A87FD93
MTEDAFPQEPGGRRAMSGEAVLNALPLPVLTIGGDERILHCNHAAEAFFDYSARLMQRRRLRDIIPFASPIIALVADVRRRRASVSEYRVELTQPRLGLERSVDVFATPLADDDDAVVMMLQ